MSAPHAMSPHYTAILRAAGAMSEHDSLRPALLWALDRLSAADRAATYTEAAADALVRARAALAPPDAS